MTRGESIQTKVHYKGSNDDFVVFVDDVDTYHKWRSDKSIPLAHFVSTFKVFTTHKCVGFDWISMRSTTNLFTDTVLRVTWTQLPRTSSVQNSTLKMKTKSSRRFSRAVTVKRLR